MSAAVLVIDDDRAMQRVLGRALESRGWRVASAYDGESGVELFQAEAFDVVLLDLAMPGIGGLEVLRHIRERDADAAVLMMTGDADIPTAVEAMRLGAENFLAKPVDLTYLTTLVDRAVERVALKRTTEGLRRQYQEQRPLEALGTTPAMREVAARVRTLAPSDATVLLLGETGTGKGWIAELIHSLSSRARQPFVEVNCAGLSSTFLESELFGHEKGAFTDARTQKRGLFEVAHGGTVFLDEIGDLALELQPKLLKALESRRFRRLGGTREIAVDVRLIAATNHDLEARVREGRFRSDLFFRIAPHVVSIPPLRERGAAALAALSEQILASLRRSMGRGPTTLSRAALERMATYAWPGNIRELRNVLEHVVLHSGGGEEVLPAALPATLSPGPALRAGDASQPRELGAFLAAAERQHIERVLASVNGSRQRAARELGISRTTLFEKMRRLGIHG